MKKNVKLLGMVAMFSVALASCTNDELKEVYQGEEISFTTRMTRAVETNTINLESFRVYAHAENYDEKMFINGRVATKGEGDVYSITSASGGGIFWPSGVKKIQFWAYGPYASETDGVKVDPAIGVNDQKLENFVASPSMTVGGKDHKDLIVAYEEVEHSASKGTTVHLKFKHALAQIVVKAKRTDTKKTVKIKGAWLMNVNSKATLHFEKDQSDNMSWVSLGNLANYGVTDALTLPDNSGISLADKSSFLIGASDATSVENTSLMLVPQTGNAWDKSNTSVGTYILLLCRVEAEHEGAVHEGGNSDDVRENKENNTHTHQLFPYTKTFDEEQYGYTCVPIKPEWEHGKKYVYNLEFCGATSGAGIYPPEAIKSIAGLPKDDEKTFIFNRPEGKNVGEPVLDYPISFTVDVASWTPEGSDGEDKDTPMN